MGFLFEQPRSPEVPVESRQINNGTIVILWTECYIKPSSKDGDQTEFLFLYFISISKINRWFHSSQLNAIHLL